MSRTHAYTLLLSIQMLVAVRGRIDLQVSLQSYSNPNHLDCGGNHCEGFGSTGLSHCDNRFEFCLRTTTSSSCLSSTRSAGNVEDDSFVFSLAIRSQLGLSDPIVFANTAPPGPLVLDIRVIDVDDSIFDTNGDDHVDTIPVEISNTVSDDGVYTSVMSYSGQCGGVGRATISLRYRIVSRCDAYLYGRLCNNICIPVFGQYSCNYLGQRICQEPFTGVDCTDCITNYYGDRCDIVCTPTTTLSCDNNGNQTCRHGNFVAPGCTQCLPDYYPQGSCATPCTPRDDNTGHYTCNTDGSRTCLRNYAGTNCLNCTADYYGVNCTVRCVPPPGNFMCNKEGEVVCRGNYTAPSCNVCLPNHYGPTCATYCLARDDSQGHYNCNPDGTITCVLNFAGSNCLDCKENWFREDCSKYCKANTLRHRCNEQGFEVCNGNYEEPNCNTCSQNYYGSTCSVFCESQPNQYMCIHSVPYRLCLGNYAAPDCTLCIDNYYRPDEGCSVFCAPTADRSCDEDGRLTASTQETPQPSSLSTGIYVAIGIGILIALVGCLGCTVCCCYLLGSQGGKGDLCCTCSDFGKGLGEGCGEGIILCCVAIICFPCVILISILTCGAVTWK